MVGITITIIMMANKYKLLFEEQQEANLKCQQKILELEAKQRLIECSFRNLRQLRQELASVDKEAQFNNQQIHQFLSSFLPDYKLQQVNKTSDANNNSLKPVKPPPPVLDIQQQTAENGVVEDEEDQLVPLPNVSYEWTGSKPVYGRIPSHLPRCGYYPVSGRSSYGLNSSSLEELKLDLKFETSSYDLPAKVQLEILDNDGRTVFQKRQNVYYIRLQEKLATLDGEKDYVLKITAIQGDCKSDEQVTIHNKNHCDGRKQVAQPVAKRSKPQNVINQAHQDTAVATHMHSCHELAPDELNVSTANVSCEANRLSCAAVSKKPVVLVNQEDVNNKSLISPEPENDAESTASVTRQERIMVPKPVLPELLRSRWHRGFRHNLGRYQRVLVLKIEMDFDSDLQDLLCPRQLQVQLDYDVVATNTGKKSQAVVCKTDARISQQKCRCELVLFDPDSAEKSHFLLSISATPESDVQSFQIDLGHASLNEWKTFHQPC